MFSASAFAGISAVVVLAGAAHAQAPAPAAQKQIAVNYADLDISHRDGAAMIIARLKAAAAQVCGPAPDIRQLQMSHLYRVCVADARARGVASLNSPLVTELYAANAGRDRPEFGGGGAGPVAHEATKTATR